MTAGFSHRTTMIDNLHEVETVLALCGNSNCRQENDPPIRDLLPRDGFSRLRRTVYCGLMFSDSATTYDMQRSHRSTEPIGLTVSDVGSANCETRLERRP